MCVSLFLLFVLIRNTYFYYELSTYIWEAMEDFMDKKIKFVFVLQVEEVIFLSAILH